MKAANIIVVSLLAVLCAAGWISVTTEKTSAAEQVNEYLTLAEDCEERGLYQRASENYLAAMNGEPDEELYVKAVESYRKRYEQAPEESEDAYFDLLEEALASFPANRALLDAAIPAYQEEENYRELYTLLNKAIKAGCADEDIIEKYRAVRYVYDIRDNEFEELLDPGTGIYTVKRDGKWNLYDSTSGFILTGADFAGPCGEDGTAVVSVGMDMLYSTSEKKVLGIFKGGVTGAGLFEEGLVPVEINGSWGYYDDYGDHVFGSYAYAGTFQDGLGAVDTGKGWMLVDKNGEPGSEVFDRIVLDTAGRYKVDGTVLVKKGGEFILYDKDWKEQWRLNCDEMGVRTGDGLVAFRKGNLWGFADMDGNVVTEPKYAGAKSYSNGLAAILDGGLWGFIDKEGHRVIECDFLDAGYMNGKGLCPVLVEETDSWEDTAASWRLLKLELGITQD